MKIKFLAFALMIAAMLAISVSAFGSPPAAKEKPAIVHQVSTVDTQQVSPVFVQQDVDAVLAMPVERITVAGEIAKAQRYERRMEGEPDSYTNWISEVPTPPNRANYNGFANTRPREQV